MLVQLLNLSVISILQFFSGWAIIHLFKLELKGIVKVALAVLIGVFVSSCVPLLLEFLSLTISLANVYLFFVCITIGLNIKNRGNIPQIKELFRIKQYSIRLYEWAFILPILFLLLLSAWKCYYTPPTPRDIIVGAELLAKHAVKEGTIISSVFTDNIPISSANLFKPPYPLGLQIVYKLAGFEFGKLWLIKNVFFFTVFLYQVLKEKLHPILVGAFILLFTAIPEMYAYTYLILYDYSNAIFFAIGAYFAQQYFEKRELRLFIFSALMMGFATFIRPETLYFIGLGSLFLFILELRHNRLQAFIKCFYYLAIPFFFYAIWSFVFVKFYMPVSYDFGSRVNPDIYALDNIYRLFKTLNKTLIWGKSTYPFYGHFIEIFLISTILNLILFRSKSGWQLLVWILIIYVGYIILSHILPLVNITTSIKRGFFKLFPIMLMYFSYNKLFLRLSEKISRWEYT